MREKPPIRFKDIPMFVKVGLIVAFFALPLPAFIPIALIALYYAFYVSVKNAVKEEDRLPGPAPAPASPRQPAEGKRPLPYKTKTDDITLETFKRPIEVTGSKNVVCPRCGNTFYNGKPQVCHLSNCHYE